MAAPEKFPAIVKITNDEYHASPGISKSGLWDIYDQTPGHWRYGEREEKAHFELGHVAHCAIIEPAEVETRYRPIPDLSKNSNAYKDLVAAAKADGYAPVPVNTFDKALRIRDAAQRNPTLRALLNGARCEQAAYAIDEETGMLVRVKPDIYNARMKLIADIKTSRDASPAGFATAVADYGYHVQDQMYQHVWSAAGKKVNGFVFVVIEPDAPHAVACYECDTADKAEGFAIYRKALGIYAEHFKREQKDPNYVWPMYSDKVETVRIKRYKFRETQAPEDRA